MAIFNTTDTIGIFLTGITNNMTGDITLTLITLMFVIMLFFLALRIPLEFTAILIVPLLIVVMVYDSSHWKSITSIIVFYLAIMFAKFFLK